MTDEFDALLGPSTPRGSGAAPPAVVTVPATAGGERATNGGLVGADQVDQSMMQWMPLLRSADADMLPDKLLTDARSRDMARSDAFVQGGSNLHKDNIVGAQYMLNARPSSLTIFGKVDDTWEEEFQEEVEEKFDIAAESPDNWFDAQRTNTFTNLIRLGVGIHFAAGEMLGVVEYLRDPRPFSTAIQMIDLDRLSTQPESQMDRNVRAGIRYDRYGAPIAYQIRTEHPNDLTWSMTLPKWKEVPIRKPWGRLQVIHIHEQVRPDQSRGVSELAAALREMKFTRRFRDTQLQRAIMQSLFAATITSELDTQTLFQSLGGSQLNADNAQALVANYASGFLSAVNEYTSGAKQIHLDGARIPHLFPGTKLEMVSPSQGTALGVEFEQSLLRYIASACGVSYEQLSRDYTQTNYSSARAAMTETWKYMQSRKKLVADRFASIMYRLWLEEQINKGEITTFPKAKAGLLYSNDALSLRFDAISRAEWIGASRGQIDELKETQAAVLRINNGLSTAEDELARLGRDWRKVYRQLKREQSRREQLKLVFVGPGNTGNALSAEPTDEPAADGEGKDSKAA